MQHTTPDGGAKKATPFNHLQKLFISFTLMDVESLHYKLFSKVTNRYRRSALQVCQLRQTTRVSHYHALKEFLAVRIWATGWGPVGISSDLISSERENI